MDGLILILTFTLESGIKFLSHIFPDGSDGKNPPAMQETQARSLGWEDSPREGNGYSLQYSYLENPMDRAWQAAVHGVAEPDTSE